MTNGPTDRHTPATYFSDYHLLKINWGKRFKSNKKNNAKQAGAEIGQAQLLLGLRYRHARVAKVKKSSGKIGLELLIWSLSPTENMCCFLLINPILCDCSALKYSIWWGYGVCKQSIYMGKTSKRFWVQNISMACSRGRRS